MLSIIPRYFFAFLYLAKRGVELLNIFPHYFVGRRLSAFLNYLFSYFQAFKVDLSRATLKTSTTLCAKKENLFIILFLGKKSLEPGAGRFLF